MQSQQSKTFQTKQKNDFATPFTGIVYTGKRYGIPFPTRGKRVKLAAMKRRNFNIELTTLN